MNDLAAYRRFAEECSRLAEIGPEEDQRILLEHAAACGLNWLRKRNTTTSLAKLAMLGQEGAGMAAWYARDAELEKKLAGVVVKIDEHLSNKSV
jgi:hypothetical protein